MHAGERHGPERVVLDLEEEREQLDDALEGHIELREVHVRSDDSNDSPSGPKPSRTNRRLTVPSPRRSNTVSWFPRRWNAAMSGSQRKVSVACRNTVVSPSRIETTSGLTTTLVTGTESGSTPSRPRIPVRRSRSMMPCRSVRLAILNPPKRLLDPGSPGARRPVHGHGIGTARPSQKNGWPNASRRSSHTTVAVPTPATVISDADRAGDRVTGGIERAETRGLRNGTG